MARAKVTHDPEDPAERVAGAALLAAEAVAATQGTTLKEAIVMVRLGTDEAATAGQRDDGDADGAWLASELLYRFEKIMAAMGKPVHVGFLDEPGQG
jgi:hypothetical protein